MNVLLLRPKSANMISHVGVIDLEPLDLEYLYTVTREEGFSATIHDDLLCPRDIGEVLRESNPRVVAICGYITQERIMLAYAKQVKAYDSSIFVILGGVHAEVNYQRFYSDVVDVIVHTSSLAPFRRLLHLIADDAVSEPALQATAGICYRTGAAWAVTQPVSIDPNELPIPDRSHFNQHKHLYRYLGYSPCAIVKTAFSCPYHCNFCYCRQINHGQYVERDMELVVAEIKGIDCDNIHIVDDTFLIDRKRVMQFAELIEANDIHKNFILYSRADFVVNNPDIIQALARIGVRGVIVGLEAIDDTTLSNYGKQSSQDINETCVRVLAEHGIDCLALFIIGIDAEAEDFDRLYAWIERVGLKYASVSIFTPIPGTDIYPEYEAALTSNNIEDWDFLHLVLNPTNLTRRAFYWQYYRLFIRLSVLGKRQGVYDFVDLRYITRAAKAYFDRLAQAPVGGSQ